MEILHYSENKELINAHLMTSIGQIQLGSKLKQHDFEKFISGYCSAHEAIIASKAIQVGKKTPMHPIVTVSWHLSSMKGSRSKVNENTKNGHFS